LQQIALSVFNTANLAVVTSRINVFERIELEFQFIDGFLKLVDVFSARRVIIAPDSDNRFNNSSRNRLYTSSRNNVQGFTLKKFLFFEPLPEIPIASVLVLSSLMQLVNVSRFNRAALSSLIIRIDDRAPAAFVSIRTSKVTLKKEFNEVSGFATSAREMNSVLVMDSISVTLNFIIASSVTLKSMFGNVYARIATDLGFL
jgi:hypothetical protein